MLLNADVAIKTVAVYFKWGPAEIGGLFLDRQDYKGLYYWYDFITKELSKE